MKNKLIKITMACLLVMGIGIFIQSCCSDEGHKICDLQFQMSNFGGKDSLAFFNQNLEDNIDTSYNHFEYVFSANVVELDKSCLRFLPFVSTAYATQPCLPKIVDSIPRNNISIKFDRDFNYDGNIIAAGTNILSDPNMRNAVQYESYSYYNYEGRISIDSADLSLILFDSGYYNMTFDSQTTLGRNQTIQKQVLFKP